MDYVRALMKKVVYYARSSVRFLRARKKELVVPALGVVFLSTVLYALLFHYPATFPTNYTFTIREGETISDVAEELQAEGLIRSKSVYKLLAVLLESHSGVFAGDYYFRKGQNVFTIAKRTTTGDFELLPVTVFIPEGSTVVDIGHILEEKFTKIDADTFIALAEKEHAEGYLFPDTYHFLPNADEKRVFNTMRENFDNRIQGIQEEIDRSGIPFKDIITMASLIEKESANDPEERRTISGILWNRIAIGMPLQVDAVFPYINGKNTYELSTEDLQVDSPYNTYTNPGLPPGPIANPGLDSILAAIEPLNSDYLFYLHDKTGQVHYSVSFEEHKQKKFRYLQ